MDGEEQLGQAVTVQGTALNAHAGALLERAGARNIYIDGLDRWPPEVYGKPVEVTGTLQSRRLAPEPVVSEGGIPSHGMAGGERLVLEGATWRLTD